MPSVILKGMKTVYVTDKPWSSPDGKVTIWMIKLEDPSGERGDYSTMSKAIATNGWSGDVELYTNDKGKEYVRQAPKEDAVQAPKGFDTRTMYVSYAKDLYIAMYEKDGSVNNESFKEALAYIKKGGAALMAESETMDVADVAITNLNDLPL